MVNGRVVDIENKKEMNTEIQEVAEKQFGQAYSTKITLSSLQQKMGYLSDTDFSKKLLDGIVDIPDDVDNSTVLVLEEIDRLGMSIKNEDGQQFTITPK